MADIELVIRIPEQLISEMDDENYQATISWFDTTLYRALKDSTVLPKGHGRLKDVDKIISDGRSKGFCDWYDEMKYADTIIEADKGGKR